MTAEEWAAKAVECPFEHRRPDPLWSHDPARCFNCKHRKTAADAIRAAQADALREAAESIHSSQSIETSIQSWLRARADAIERGEDEQ